MVAHGRDEGGERGEVRLAVAGDGHEQNILAARCFDLSAADRATTVGQQDDLDQDRRVKRGGALEIVLITGVESG